MVTRSGWSRHCGSLVNQVNKAEPAGLYTSLARRASQTSDAMLVALESLGLLAVLAILFWIPRRPELTMPFVSLAMFGLWGVAEHVRRNRASSGDHGLGTLLSVLQIAVVIAGSVAAALAIYGAVFLTIGPIIS